MYNKNTIFKNKKYEPKKASFHPSRINSSNNNTSNSMNNSIYIVTMI